MSRHKNLQRRNSFLEQFVIPATSVVWKSFWNTPLVVDLKISFFNGIVLSLKQHATIMFSFIFLMRFETTISVESNF